MRRETDLLQGLRDKKEKIVFHPSDHFMPDLLSDKQYHGMQGLNGFPSNLMKNNFKFDGLNRASKDEMFMKNSQSKMCESICKPKRVTKISKSDGHSCARTRPLAFLVRRQTVQGKSNQSSIVPRNVVLKNSILGKQCCRRQRVVASRASKAESYHPVLSAKNGKLFILLFRQFYLIISHMNEHQVSSYTHITWHAFCYNFCFWSNNSSGK